MLRTLTLSLALGWSGVAAAQEFPRSALHAVVTTDNGTAVGRVEGVERNADGDIVAVEIPGLEPGDAPHAPSHLVAARREGEPARQQTAMRNHRFSASPARSP